MSTQSKPITDAHVHLEATIKQLQDELNATREIVIGLMPSEVCFRLTRFYGLESRQQAEEWQRSTIDFILGLAEVLPKDPLNRDKSDRAKCPLCREGSLSYMARGFKVPNGLRQHLEGAGNAEQCAVTKVAFALAWNYLNPKFLPAEREARRLDEEALARRLGTETLYNVDPRFPPQLADQGIWGREARSTVQMEFAEARLKQLGFELKISGNIKAWERADGAHTTYADPRQAARLDFLVLENNQSSRSKKSAKFVGTFYLLDDWKSDLLGKYAVRASRLIGVSAESIQVATRITQP